jgi:DNA-directed RNA polymerase subunit K/omega
METLTKYEITRILSARAEQISFGAPPLVKAKKDDTARGLTQREFDKKVIPLAILRTINGKKEIISVN